MSDPTLLDLMRMRNESTAQYTELSSVEVPNLMKCSRLKARITELDKNIAVVSQAMMEHTLSQLPRLPSGIVDLDALFDEDFAIGVPFNLELAKPNPIDLGEIAGSIVNSEFTSKVLDDHGEVLYMEFDINSFLKNVPLEPKPRRTLHLVDSVLDTEGQITQP